MLVAGDITRPQNLQGSSDYFSIAPHGVANTHLDALCHIFRDGKMYNGFDQAEVTSVGARRNSIMSGKDGVVSRGVLLDIPALHGVPYLELGERITVEDLEAAEARQGVTVSEGDILLVCIGRDARREEHGYWTSGIEGIAGLSVTCAPWIRERGVAVMGCDGITDAMPHQIEGWDTPMHQVLIVSRQHAARPPRRRLRGARSLGVPAHPRAAASGPGHRLPGQPDRDALVVERTRRVISVSDIIRA